VVGRVVGREITADAATGAGAAFETGAGVRWVEQEVVMRRI